MLENTDRDDLNSLREQAMDLFKQAEAGWREIRLQALEDLAFFHGKQWDEQLINIARLKKEPTLQVNRLPQFVKQIENELRQRDMAITVAATDEIGSDDTANIFTGLIRGIEARSNAKAHYIHAAGENGALVPGVGYLKVEVDYADASGFNQDISIKSVKDPMTIICDPNALEPDFSDAEYWFEFQDYPEKTFKKLFPRAECTTSDMFPLGVSNTGWIKDKMIRVARFWYKEERSITYFLLDDGTVEVEERVDSIVDDEEDSKRYAMVGEDKKAILRERRVTDCVVKWMDFSGAEVLNEGEWAGKHFPFVAVTGPMSIIDGKRDIRGIIRFAKDSQQMLNFMASSAARRIASANKSPWIVDMKSISAYKDAWARANRDNMPFLPYDAYDVNSNGRQNPPPTRADQSGQIQDLLMAAEKFENDLKATIGIYDAGLGATPNDQSGVAIKTLAQQGQNANFHFSDNLTSALKRLGEILVDMAPKIYDTERIVKIVGADRQERMVKINGLVQEKGEMKEYNLRDAAGHYGVTINVGPAYATQKQAAIEQMLELCRVNPNIMPYVQDIIAGNMDFEGKEVVRDRLLKVLAIQAPQVIDNPDVPDVPPQVVAAMQQQSAMIEQLSVALQEMQTEYAKLQFTLQSKQAEHQFAMEKARQDAELQAVLEAQKTASQKDIEIMRAEREMRVATAEADMQAVKTQLAHTEKMMQLVMQAMKQFGTQADEVIADILPPSGAIVDGTVNTMPSL